MKKLLSLILACIAVIACSEMVCAQQKTEISAGIFLATYGNVTVIENNNTQQTVRIKVQKNGDSMFDILCGDTLVKTVAKAGLKEGIAYAIQYYTAIPKWISRVIIGRVVDKAYDGTCNYFKKHTT